MASSNDPAAGGGAAILRQNGANNAPLATTAVPPAEVRDKGWFDYHYTITSDLVVVDTTAVQDSSGGLSMYVQQAISNYTSLSTLETAYYNYASTAAPIAIPIPNIDNYYWINQTCNDAQSDYMSTDYAGAPPAPGVGLGCGTPWMAGIQESFLYCQTNSSVINPMCVDNDPDCTFLSFVGEGTVVSKYTFPPASGPPWDDKDPPTLDVNYNTCLQTGWPSSNADARTACCLGIDVGPYNGSNYGWANSYCKPSWNPYDPQGECEDDFISYCAVNSVSVDSSSQTWVHGWLGTDTTCGDWYWSAVGGKLVPQTRWGAIDRGIQEYCAQEENMGGQSCGCSNFGLGSTLCNVTSSDTSACFLYTSVSGADPPSPNLPNVLQANLVDGTTGFAMGVSDFACLAPQCQFSSDARPQSLIPFDVWFAQKETCPHEMCIQVIDGLYVQASDVTANAIYIGGETGVCGGSMGSISEGAPSLQMDATQSNIVFVNQVSGDCPLGICGAEATLSFMNSSPNTLSYSVTTPHDWPSWIEFSDPAAVTGSVSDFTQVVEFTITDVTKVPTGVSSWDLTVSDLIFTGVKRKTAFQVMGIPQELPPPPLPPVPNPGAGIPIVYVNTMPPWVKWAGLASLVLLLIVGCAAGIVETTKWQAKKLIRQRASLLQ